ncbi:2-oxoglutarate dehydrogenase E1 component [Micavibrio aeruginosavorus]|uniref:oxoglutarate dehydrogenase (succinyl-transferring) n=1 Tax=Micavibrio aeruginosavorus (strain ARL-13) TaxID=856793 RepID=G2KP87_MICAA|nr:2-oxoglutarate dehydrogenase E1 component [Micavibrio aeruginosavorus]AEP08988.1 oxoglutarate dehydrogenase (succinyl-transferring), E1 component [Micavibrio aeruginosavorus ARL-13]
MTSETAKMSVLTGMNAEYIAHLYARYMQSPEKTDPSWKAFFQDLNDNELAVLQDLAGASWTPDENKRSRRAFGSNTGNVVGMTVASSAARASAPAASAELTDDVRRATLDSIRALMMVRAYRARGHLLSNLDPLELKEKTYHPELDPAHYGFSDSDYDRPIFIDGVLGFETATLREIVTALRQTYCGAVGVEFMHLSDPAEKSWIQQRIEAPRNQTDFTVEGKRAILQRLTAAESFEKFLHVKYVGTKRFGLDGGESTVPAIEQVLKRGSQLGVKEVVFGMAHRGRLNVLTNVLGKPFTAVFSEFQGNSANPDDVQGSGDVKYHLGTSTDREFDGKTLHLSLTANPSHLEVVDPVVIGKVRAKQQQRGDKDRTQVLPILLHGDAAFAGQGLVAETLMMSELSGYRVGGTVHIVINNQIGFTTMPQYSRSGPYPTDVAKMLAAPIFHVNGDDPEAVVHAARIAIEFRQEFKKDVVIDLVCYRRYGHNEGDEPAFTQPLMYKKIKTHMSVRDMYSNRLVADGTLSEAESKAMVDEFNTYLEQAFEATKSYKPNKADFLEGAWTGLKVASGDERRGVTAIDDAMMQKLGKALTTVPANFNINSKIARQLEAKADMFKTGQGFDWATAEALAYGSLAAEGYNVRLSGQDCQRGTFSQRHAVVTDQEDESKYCFLQHIGGNQGTFEVHDSPLSEAAVLGFEYGYSLADPKTLVLWEAQFGDFVNGAQVVIDQFISSAETKWLRMSGLVMLLPHGFEGQGPEHSSARMERFLQNCAEDNWQVANCTTPANYFHILRRQMVRDFRKPLIIMTPKSLLRHKLAVSPASMMTGQSTFHRILWDDAMDQMNKPKDIKRVIICSGKVYYDLFEEREKRGQKDVIILRLEQFYPFPAKALGEELSKYPNAEVIWCQEEPYNQGGWHFVDRRIEDVLKSIKHKSSRPRYAGRPEAAAPATGLMKRHNAELAKFLDEALKG